MRSRPHILGTGLSGLVGSALTSVLSVEYQLTNLDLSTGVDITNQAQVSKALEESDGGVVIHLAAFTDVSKAHLEAGDKSGIVYRVNVSGTRYIAQACQRSGKHLIHLSTAYVFDGEKTGLYVESDLVHPIEWYGQTKAWAEEEVLSSGVEYTILRIDQPYQESTFIKKDLLHRIKEGLEQGTLPPMFTDHTFTPTHLPTLSQWIKLVISRKLKGVYHATTDAVTTDYQFAQKVKQQYGLAGSIRTSSVVDFVKTAPRPYQKNTALDNQAIRKALGVTSL